MRRETKRMGGDFNRGYANKLGQERKGKAKRRALNVRMKWQGRMVLRELKENPWKEGRALRETMERSAQVAREIVLLSRLTPRSRLNKAGPHFSRFLAKSCPTTRASSSLCLFKPSIILLLLLASRTVEVVNAGPIEPNVIY